MSHYSEFWSVWFGLAFTSAIFVVMTVLYWVGAKAGVALLSVESIQADWFLVGAGVIPAFIVLGSLSALVVGVVS